MRLTKFLVSFFAFPLIVVMTAGVFAGPQQSGKPIQLIPSADLAADSINLSKPIMEGDKIGAQSMFNITVKNTGKVASAACKVKLTVTAVSGGPAPAELTGEWHCRALAPGESMGFPWPNLSNAVWAAGQYRLTVEADSGKVIDEDNEQNNFKTFDFTVSRKLTGSEQMMTGQKQAQDAAGHLFPVRVTSPAGGEWVRGGKLPITFTTTPAAGSLVKILIKKGSDTFYSLNHIGVNASGTTTYNWPIPQDAIAGDDYQAEVVSEASASLKGVSGRFSIRIVSPSSQAEIKSTKATLDVVKATAIQVTRPTANDHWVLPGEGTVTVTWQSRFTTKTEKVNIKLLREDGSLVKPLAANVSFAAGSFKWPLAGVSLDAGKYRIELTDIADNEIQGMSAAFYLDAPAITLISPAAGEQWVRSAKRDIVWTYTGNVDRKVRILVNDQAIADNIPINAGNQGPGKGSHSWTPPLNMSVGNTIKVLTVDGKTESVPVNFHLRQPEVAITQPGGGETWYSGMPHKVSWAYNGNPDHYVRVFFAPKGFSGFFIEKKVSDGSMTVNADSNFTNWLELAKSDSIQFRIIIHVLQSEHDKSELKIASDEGPLVTFKE